MNKIIQNSRGKSNINIKEASRITWNCIQNGLIVQNDGLKTGTFRQS